MNDEQLENIILGEHFVWVLYCLVVDLRGAHCILETPAWCGTLEKADCVTPLVLFYVVLSQNRKRGPAPAHKVASLLSC